MSDPTQELINECRRQSENCAYTSTSFTIWLRWLKGVRLVSATAPIILAAVATAKIVSQTSPTLAAVCTLLAAVIPPVYRASKTDAAIDDYTKFSGEFTNLRDRFRYAANISSHRPFAEFEAESKPFFDRLDAARQCALTPPEWFFKLARWKHKAGHYTHDADESGPGAAE